jgi:hypothetical protein
MRVGVTITEVPDFVTYVPISLQKWKTPKMSTFGGFWRKKN